MIKKKIYENGLTVILEPMPYMKSASAGIYIRSGSVYETKETNGIAHFIEHMLFKGTSRRSAQQISEEADDLGGTLNAYTAEECTCIYIKVLAEQISKALDLILDIAGDPLFDKADIENEKKVIIEEIASANDDPEDAAQEVLMSNMFREHPVGMPVLGNRKNVSSFSREDISSFYSKHFQPERMVISVAGAIDENEVFSVIEKSRFANENGEKESDIKAGHAEINGGYFYSKRDTGQLQLVAGWPAVSLFDEKMYAFTLLAGILGSDGSSRLFRRLREEKGLVYNVDASTLFYEENGVFLVNTSFSAENTDTICRIMREEINDIIENGVTERELSRTKRNIISAMKLETESTMSVMSRYGKSELFRTKYTDEEIFEKYMVVSNEDIKEAARFAFGNPEKEAVAVVGETHKRKISILR